LQNGHKHGRQTTFEFAGGHAQDLDSTVAYSKFKRNSSSRAFFDSSSSLVDHVDASQVSAMVSGNILCRVGFNASAHMRLAHDTGNSYRCPICDVVSRRPQDRKRHTLSVASAMLAPVSGG